MFDNFERSKIAGVELFIDLFSQREEAVWLELYVKPNHLHCTGHPCGADWLVLSFYFGPAGGAISAHPT